MIRSIVPDADITTDFLVGFPSETDDDFAATLVLAEQVRFTAAFMFAYSQREGTAAASLPDDVPRELKIDRLNRLIALQTSITREVYEKTVGATLDVMFYGPIDKKGSAFLKGRNMGCKRVLIPCTDVRPGTILPVRALRSSGMTLIGERI